MFNILNNFLEISPYNSYLVYLQENCVYGIKI
jgi:hypothetical protein